MSLALYICSLPLFRIDRIEMVLDHTRKTFQEIFRYVTMVTSVKNLWTKIDHRFFTEVTVVYISENFLKCPACVVENHFTPIDPKQGQRTYVYKRS